MNQYVKNELAWAGSCLLAALVFAYLLPTAVGESPKYRHEGICAGSLGLALGLFATRLILAGTTPLFAFRKRGSSKRALADALRRGDDFSWLLITVAVTIPGFFYAFWNSIASINRGQQFGPFTRFFIEGPHTAYYLMLVATGAYAIARLKTLSHEE